MWWHEPRLLQAYIEDFVIDHLRVAGVPVPIESGDLDRVLTAPAEAGLSSLQLISMVTRFCRTTGIDRSGLGDLLLARRSLPGWMKTTRQSLDLTHERFGFHSSGTTGDASFTEHSLWKLEREMRHFAEQLPSISRVVSTVPSHHIYGFLWSILLPSLLQCPVLRLDPTRQLLSDWPRLLSDQDLIIATPDIWQILHNNEITLPGRFTGISSTAPMAPAVFAGLLHRHKEARFHEIYGSSETAGIAWRDDPAKAFELLRYWSLEGGDESGFRLRDNDEPQNPAILLQDNIDLEDRRRFRINGRKDRVEQFSGHNINLGELRSRLLQHPDIDDADVRSTGSGAARSLRFALQLQARPENLERWCQDFTQWSKEALGKAPPAVAILLTPVLPRSAVLNKASNWNADDYESVGGRFVHGFNQGTARQAG